MKHYFEKDLNHINVVYSGKFNPFHKGHKFVYDALLRVFHNVFVFTNLTNPPYFTPKEKKDILELSGVDPNNIVDNTGLSGYNIKQIADKINADDNEILVLVFSEKDLEDSSKASFLNMPKDGVMAYEIIRNFNEINNSHTLGYVPKDLSDIQKLAKQKKKHAYIYICDTLEDVKGNISSSRIRALIEEGNWDEVVKLVASPKVVNYLRYINKDIDISEGAIEKLTASYEEYLSSDEFKKLQVLEKYKKFKRKK